MSEPHNSIQPGPAEFSAATKGGSLSGTQAITRTHPPTKVHADQKWNFPVTINAEVLVEDAAMTHEMALADADPAVCLRSVVSNTGCGHQRPSGL